MVMTIRENKLGKFCFNKEFYIVKYSNFFYALVIIVIFFYWDPTSMVFFLDLGRNLYVILMESRERFSKIKPK